MARKSRTYDAEATRKKILEEAFETFLSTGYSAAPLQDIMKRAGVTGGALYHHFPSKKALGLAVIEGPIRTAIEGCWMSPLASAPTAFAGVRAALREMLASMDERKPRRGCPLNNIAQELAGQDKGFQRAISGVFREWSDVLAAKINADMAEGRLPQNISPQAVADFIIAGAEGALGLTKAHQSVQPLHTFAGQIEVYLGAIEAARPPRSRRRGSST